MAIKGMQGTVMLSDKAPGYKQKWRMHKELSDALKLIHEKGAKLRVARACGSSAPSTWPEP